MNYKNIAPSFFKGSAIDLQHQKILHLRKGQVFVGQVLKLFPPHMAVLRLGGINVTARMEAALSAGENYVFRVRENEGVPHLQVIQKQQASSARIITSSDITKVLQSMDVETNRTNQTIASLLLEEEAPLSKELFSKGGPLLTSNNMLNKEGIRTLLIMDKRQLPLTNTVFQSIRSNMDSTPISTTIQELMNAIENTKEQKNMAQSETKALQRVFEALKQTKETTFIQNSEKGTMDTRGTDFQVKHSSTKTSENTLINLMKESAPNIMGIQNTSAIAAQLKKILNQIGFLHEKTQLNSSGQSGQHPNMQLKHALLENVTRLPYSVKDSAETLLYRITGQQLLSQDQHGLLHQVTLQLPLIMGDHETDLSIQWEGKKTSEGNIHSDHCRILFYLNLEALGETAADLQIQSRTVSLCIYNDQPESPPIINILQPLLRESLKKLNYNLSSVSWKQMNDKTITKRDMYQSNIDRRGFDIRV